MVGGVDTGIVFGKSNNGVVTPTAVIIGKDVPHFHARGVNTDFFTGFANSSSHDVFVRIAGTAWHCPCATTVSPSGTQLQEHMRWVQIGAHQ